MSEPKYRKIFKRHHGEGPWPCHFCPEEIQIGELVVHHDDGDHENEDLSNLIGCHRSCHIAHHMSDEEARKAISEALAGKPKSPETRRKMKESYQERLRDPSRRANQWDSTIQLKGT